jgi:hypothetical protein
MKTKVQWPDKEGNHIEQPVELPVETDVNPFINMARKEYGALREFAQVLLRERDAILSFSSTDIVWANNEKKDIIGKLTSLRTERIALMQPADKNKSSKNDEYRLLTKAIKQTMREVRTSLRRNDKLLSLSANHVKTAIECIIGAINRASPVYGKQVKLKPILVSRRA